MNPQLMNAVVHAMASFEACPDEVLDPDTATQQLECITSDLRQMAPADQANLLAFVDGLKAKLTPRRLVRLSEIP